MAAPLIAPAVSADDLAAVAGLFREYAATLDVDLGFQGFEAEVASLPGKYAPPRGVLLLARGEDGAALGCVALRPLEEDGCCEVKRLFLRPEARGSGLGRALAEAVIGRAASLGYREARLDTLDSMRAAIGLYAELGFHRRPAYYAPTPPGTIFMARTL